MPVSFERWGEAADDHAVMRVTLRNTSGMTVKATNLGATLLSVETPDRQGHSANVNLCFNSAAEYQKHTGSFGATIGRFANRIGRGKFTLDGQSFKLAINNGPNHLHGGPTGFAHRSWEATAVEEKNAVTFRYHSPDGEEGFPGNMDVTVTYRLTDNNELFLEYTATTDKPTVVNLTNHAYWNLAGAGSGDIYKQELQIQTTKFLDCDKDVLPTGDILSVLGTAYDFTKPTPIGLHISETGGGFDNCFVISDWDSTLRKAARMKDPQSGRVMEVFTTEPSVQLYTANHFNGGPDAAGFGKHHAFCLECQHFPDAPNQPKFATTVLRPGEKYSQQTMHRFSVE